MASCAKCLRSFLPCLIKSPKQHFDKIVENRLQQKRLSKLDLEPKCHDHRRNQKTMTWGTKNMEPKKFEQRSLSNWCDADYNADAESSKTICGPNPMGVDIISIHLLMAF